MRTLKFNRCGNVFNPDGKIKDMQSHAQVPFAYQNGNSKFRIFFASRDKNSRSHVYFIDYDFANKTVLNISQKPSLAPGALGTFDDCGTMPSWFLDHNDKIYMYYTAWNLGGSVSYRLSIGLAISTDGGQSFQRLNNAPILDRSQYDPGWVAQPCVIKGDNLWRMWYLSCTKWEMINNHPEPFYHVKYAESTDGINWQRRGVVSVDYDSFTDAIGRPSVIKTSDGYLMFYSFRNARNYRSDPSKSYRMGLAFSKDGIAFERMDDKIEFTGEKLPWENLMQDYAHVIQHKNQMVMFYNGNGFGQSGFGYATCDEVFKW